MIRVALDGIVPEAMEETGTDCTVLFLSICGAFWEV